MLAAIGAVQGAVRMATPRDGDSFWGAKSGLDTIRTGHVPRHDTYSWSMPGHSWIPSSWGWDVVLGALYDVFGMAGFVVAAVALGVLLGTLVALVSRRIGAKPLPTMLVFAVVGAFALNGVPRGTTMSTIIAAAVLLPVPAVLGGSPRQRWRALAALTALQVAWINLHSGGLLGPVLVAIFGAGHVLWQPADRRRAMLVRLAGVVACLVAACHATPYGWSLIAHAPRVRTASVGLISEWRPYSLGILLSPTGIITAAGVVIAVWTTLRVRRYDRLFVLLVTIALAVSAVRFTPIVLVFVLPEVALLLGRFAIRDRLMQAATAVVLLGLVAASFGGLVNFGHVEQMWGSPKLVREIPAGCRLFNDDVIAGMVILLRPDVPVWTDGRNDMYGRTRVTQGLNVADWAPGAARWISAHQITCALVPASRPIGRELANVPGWRVAGSDASRVLLVRSATP
jgi:MFS family permease